jgi:hypothetical protein
VTKTETSQIYALRLKGWSEEVWMYTSSVCFQGNHGGMTFCMNDMRDRELEDFFEGPSIGKEGLGLDAKKGGEFENQDWEHGS